MEKRYIILALLILGTIALVVFLIIKNQPDEYIEAVVPNPALDFGLDLHLEDAEILLQNTFDPATTLESMEYRQSMEKAQQSLSFPLQIPRGTISYTPEFMRAWAYEGREEFSATYKGQYGFAALTITKEFSPEAFGPPNETPLLQNGERASFWVFEGKGSIPNHKLLLFSLFDHNGETYYYFIESDDLSLNELLELANSSISN
ncbi:MAG: hypothetical protein Q8P71_02540 [bacterium]|nr:hypothetical protein [bacterium]